MEEREDYLTNIIDPRLACLIPGSSVYLNQANFQEKNAQQEFFDAKLACLLLINKKFDPYDIFYASNALEGDG